MTRFNDIEVLLVLLLSLFVLMPIFSDDIQDRPINSNLLGNGAKVGDFDIESSSEVKRTENFSIDYDDIKLEMENQSKHIYSSLIDAAKLHYEDLSLNQDDDPYSMVKNLDSMSLECISLVTDANQKVKDNYSLFMQQKNDIYSSILTSNVTEMMLDEDGNLRSDVQEIRESYAAKVEKEMDERFLSTTKQFLYDVKNVIADYNFLLKDASKRLSNFDFKLSTANGTLKLDIQRYSQKEQSFEFLISYQFMDNSFSTTVMVPYKALTGEKPSEDISFYTITARKEYEKLKENPQLLRAEIVYTLTPDKNNSEYVIRLKDFYLYDFVSDNQLYSSRLKETNTVKFSDHSSEIPQLTTIDEITDSLRNDQVTSLNKAILLAAETDDNTIDFGHSITILVGGGLTYSHEKNGPAGSFDLDVLYAPISEVAKQGQETDEEPVNGFLDVFALLYGRPDTLYFGAGFGLRYYFLDMTYFRFQTNMGINLLNGQLGLGFGVGFTYEYPVGPVSIGVTISSDLFAVMRYNDKPDQVTKFYPNIGLKGTISFM